MNLNLGTILFELAIVDRGRFRGALKEIEEQLDVTTSKMGQFSLKTERVGLMMQKVAKDLTLQWSLASGIIVGTVTNLAVKYEKSMAEVQRTTQETDASILRLKDRFLELSKSLPTSNAALKLADIASIGGQAGIKGAENLEKFSLGILKLTTVFEGLDEKETALKMIQIVNAFGGSVEDIERYGSVISRVSRESAATASQLITFTQAVSGNAKNLGLTYAQIVALGGSLIDLGVPANVAGTAMTNFFAKMQTKTTQFAHDMKMSIPDYKNLIHNNPFEAMTKWLEELSKNGDNNFVINRLIEELGIRGAKAENVIQKLRVATDDLRDSTSLANAEWSNATDLENQFVVISRTTAAEMQRMKNEGIALAVKIGYDFLPVLRLLSNGLSTLIGIFDGLNPVIRNFIFSFGTVIAFAGPLLLILGNLTRALGAFGVVLTSVSAVGTAFVGPMAAGQVATNSWVVALASSHPVFFGITAAVIALTAALAIFASTSKYSNDDTLASIQSDQHYVEGLLKKKTAVVEVQKQIDKINSSNENATEKQKKLNEQVDIMARLMPGVVRPSEGLVKSLENIKKEGALAAESIIGLNNSLEGLTRIQLRRAMAAKEEEIQKQFTKVGSQGSNFLGVMNYNNVPGASSLSPEFDNIKELLAKARVKGFDSSNSDMRGNAIQAQIENIWTLSDEDIDSLIYNLNNASERLTAAGGKIAKSQSGILDAFAEDLRSAKNLRTQRLALEKTYLSPVLPANPNGDGINDPASLSEEIKAQYEALKWKEEMLRKSIEEEIKNSVDSNPLTTSDQKKQQRINVIARYDDAYKAISEGLDKLKAKLVKKLGIEFKGMDAQGIVDSILKGKTDYDTSKFYRDNAAMMSNIARFPTSYKSPIINAPDAETDIHKMERELELYKLVLQGMAGKFKDEKERASDLGGGAIGRYLMGDGKTLLTNIENVRGIIFNIARGMGNDLLASDPAMLTMWKDYSTTFETTGENFDKLVIALKSLTPEESEKILSLIKSMNSVQAVRPNDDYSKSKKDRSDLENHLDVVSKMGVTAKNSFEVMERGYRNMSQRIAQMAFNTKLQMKDVWQGMATDFISMFVDQVTKNLFAGPIATMIAGLFGGPAGAVASVIPTNSDFLMRSNGTVMGFHPDDNIVGYKNPMDLLANILPSIVSPDGGFSKNREITVKAPDVNINNQSPTVEIFMESLLDGQKFLRKNQPKYSRSNQRRKLAS